MIWKGDWANRAIPLAGYYLLPIFGAPFVMLLSLATANISGSTKQTITNGLIFVGYCVGEYVPVGSFSTQVFFFDVTSTLLSFFTGNIIAPYTVFANEKAVHYRSTFIAIIVCMVASIVLTAILVLILVKENRNRNKLFGIPNTVVNSSEQTKSSEGIVDEESDDASQHVAEKDLTDKQNREKFRYVY